MLPAKRSTEPKRRGEQPVRNFLRALIKTGLLVALLSADLGCPPPVRGDSSFR